MSRKYFGTDGIRGTANTAPMTAEVALKVGMAAGHYFTRGDHRHKVVIGKDTRLSGYMLEPALVAGFTSMGMDVMLVGPMPTPAVAMLTKSMRADIGVMISASHNPFQDNGIKLFGPDGFKLSDEVELEIEALMESDLSGKLVPANALGRAKRIDDAPGRYIEAVKSSLPGTVTLEGLRIVLDCAHGAGYSVAPKVLRELGADVIEIGTSPNGLNINDQCGSTYTKTMCDRVLAEKADVGIALDGDADRVQMCDEKGHLIDGDQLMGLVVTHWKRTGQLRGNALVATVMSNLGLERYLESNDVRLIRTKVGDRYVVEQMRALDCNVGGEQSGHIVLSDFASTGDGLLAALQVLAVLASREGPVSELSRVFEPLPQILKNVRYSAGSDPLAQSSVIEAISLAERAFNGDGRILIRKSGTEPLIRVMAEGDDAIKVEQIVDGIVAEITAVAG
ncbi:MULTISPECIES: phosphoglucosamine mutase [Thalassospira]|uniref:Phosphoglucosamine mutase n=1 Tax=Thalassospira indica TaxID=1891279 RepID=A0ABM6Y4H2_9PROT|nr:MULTISPECIES: phosphoglucosamine mutase [Thalassospira]OAZ11499.1 phosphoglucosamine mutase [Thalassospira profundimaris]BDW96495.1 phosphoglucosamine mutase [Thalassospira tepidiphila]AXO16828.1 phosphoglucosamine mutase [Thalassospira indica]KZD00851.1 phosphoglucosamine mutase [Thalassospira sp. MCCC 1A02898]ONH87549.1 phosphoglucosamine mutase [Thalassospira sp. MCCC 1A02803]|tara:strand:- start:6545 stop:7894 length:1350 start_codon:yes stop_codon:yes gene_type:complete